MLFALLAAPALGWTTASTTITAPGWNIAGQDGSALHTHGGSPAQLGSARFRVMWQGPASARLTVTRIEYLTGHDCEAAPATPHGEPTLGGLFVDGMKESARELTLESGKAVDVTVGFTPVEAYYSWCDRFAFRVTFIAGAVSLTATAETNVTREEPYAPERARSPDRAGSGHLR